MDAAIIDVRHFTAQGEEFSHPSKRFYRARAHSNPLNDVHFPVPTSPADVDWCPSCIPMCLILPHCSQT